MLNIFGFLSPYSSPLQKALRKFYKYSLFCTISEKSDYEYAYLFPICPNLVVLSMAKMGSKL